MVGPSFLKGNDPTIIARSAADRYVARIDLKPLLHKELQVKRNITGTATFQIICCAQHMIWDRVADLAESGQQVWHILDFWHACEHLAMIGRLLYGEGSDRFKECFKRWRGMLQLRASIKSRRFNSDHERLLPESPPQETERMAA